MKFRSTLYGSGRVGNIVGYKGKNGEYYIREYVPHVNDANTINQQICRKKLSLLTQALSPFATFVKAGFLNNSERSAWCQLIKNNYNTIIHGEFPNLYVDYKGLILTKGSVPTSYYIDVNVERNQLLIKWNYNEGDPNADKSDKVSAVVINRETDEIMYIFDEAERIDKIMRIDLPVNWNSNFLVWTIFRRGLGECSNSYLNVVV